MQKLILDILPITLLVITLFGIKPIKPIPNLNPNYLSISTSKNYRGLFAIVIIFHHIAQRTQMGVLFRYFTMVGYLAVAFFFFLSGYGVQKSYILKGDAYRKNFLAKRLSSILIPYIIVTLLYWIMYFANGTMYSFKDIIVKIVDGYPIVSNSWYIINILIFYIVFWALMCICKKHYFTMLVCGCVWYALWVIFCIKMDYGLWWYISTQVLVVGMFWANYEEKIINILQKHLCIIPFVWILFIILFLFGDILSFFIPIRGIYTIINLVRAILFSLSVIFFSMKFQIGNKVLSFLGTISLELYLIHGLFIMFLRSNILYVENDFVWSILVVACSIGFGHLLHLFINKIMEQYRSILCL